MLIILCLYCKFSTDTAYNCICLFFIIIWFLIIDYRMTKSRHFSSFPIVMCFILTLILKLSPSSLVLLIHPNFASPAVITLRTVLREHHACFSRHLDHFIFKKSTFLLYRMVTGLLVKMFPQKSNLRDNTKGCWYHKCVFLMRRRRKKPQILITEKNLS